MDDRPSRVQVMIEPTPHWTFNARPTLTQWYGHVHLLPGHALGQWFCVDRDTGRLLWERSFTRPNSVSGVADDMIVATETVSRGPGTWSAGCYGISLADGRLLWESHGSEPPEHAAADGEADGDADEARYAWDSPSSVEGDECVCQSGRVISVRDGRLLRRVTPEQIRDAERHRFFHGPWPDARVLYWTRGAAPRMHTRRRIRIDGVGWLSHRRTPDEKKVSERFRLHATDDAGDIVW